MPDSEDRRSLGVNDYDALQVSVNKRNQANDPRDIQLGVRLMF